MKRIKYISISKTGLVAMFLVILAVNFCLFFIIKKEEIDTVENREKKKFPVYDTSGVGGYMTDFEDYFADHFPYKNNYIGLLNHLKLKKLHSTNAVNKVIVGKHNWLFYNACVFDSQGFNEYAGFNPWTNEEQQKVVNNINAIERWCTAHHIKFVLLICPNKQSIYSEYLPSAYQQQFPNRYDQLFSNIKGYINLKQVFLNYRKTNQQLLYYKTDTHWNLLGGALAGAQISARLKSYYPGISNIQDLEVRDSVSKQGFDLANMMGLKDQYKDTVLIVRIKDKSTFKIPRLVVVNDSYLESLYPSLTNLFDTITQRHLYNDGIPAPQYLLDTKTDVLMIELVERYKELLTWDIHPDYYK